MTTVARWTRKNRLTGTMVSLYKADEAGLDESGGQNWYLSCEDHGTLLSTTTRKMAEHHGAQSSVEWCDQCRETYNGKEDET